MALHSEAKKALDKCAEEMHFINDGEYAYPCGELAPKAFAALNAILVACTSAERQPASKNQHSPQVSVSGLRSIIARELS